MRTGDELRELAGLGFRELGAATGGIQGIHRAVAERAFRAAGARARPTQLMHDAIASSVYSGVRGGATLVGRAADFGLAARGSGEPRALSGTPRGAALLGVLSGLIGDRLEQEGSALAQPMVVRAAGAPRPRLVVFLHGLMETELAWGPGESRYGTRLERELGLSAVYVRYNSGRHISENGESLAGLLEELVAAWPLEVEEIALVGHSMGGLVARSACNAGAQRGDLWVERVRHVISLGSPHMGAPLAQGVHWGAAALWQLPETRPFAAFLRRRSAGIRDLRQGSLVDADWHDCDPDALRARACAELPLLDGATHCFVAATVTRSPRHPLARLLGDCLVLESSASGRSRTRRLPFEAEYGMHLGGAHHLALLNHSEVYAKLRDWLG